MPPLATMASAFAIDGGIQRKISGWEVASAGKAITLMISNEDMNDISRIIDWQSSQI